MKRFLTLILLLFAFNYAAFATATWVAQSSPTDEALYGVYMTSQSTASAVGDIRTVLKTSDIGQNWASKTTPQVNIFFKGVYFLSDQTGWAVGIDQFSGVVYKTTDFGETWAQAGTNPIDSTVIHDVVFLDSNTGYACGNTGSVNAGIYKSTNGGTNWNPSNSGVSGTPDFNAVHFIDSNKGWVVGNGGVIYSTVDGGSNWAAETSGTSADLQDVYFFDEKHAFAVGAGGTILNYGLEPLFNVNPSSTYAGNSLNISLTAASGSTFYPGTTVTVSKSGGSGFSYTFNRVSDSLIDISADLDATVTTGDWTITVTGPNGRTATGTFTVNPLPHISSISPSAGIQGATGLNLTIFGSGFQNGVTFDFGSDITVNSTTFDSANQATVVIDIGTTASTGPRNVTVTNPDGGSTTATDIFTVSAPVTPPTISFVSPDKVAQGAMMDLEINGNNLQTGAVASIANNGITINTTDYNGAPNKISINISVGANATVGPRTLIVTNPDQGSSSLINAFYVQSPTVVNPVIDSLDRQIYIGWVNKNFTIIGSNFQNGATLSFTPSTGIIVNDLQFISSTQLRGIISVNSSAQPGAVTLRVMNPDGGFDEFSFNLQAQSAKLGKVTILPFPNPVNARTAKSVDFQFDMSRDGLVTLPIFDNTGRKLAELTHNGTAGKNTVTWNLKTFAGDIPANQMLLIYGINGNNIIAKGKLMIVSH